MLTRDELKCGVVSFLVTGLILTDPNTIATVPQKPYDDHYFLLFHEQQERFFITSITTVHRKERLFLHPEWRLGEGSEHRWRESPMYLTDGACFYSVLKETIVLGSLIDRDTSATRKFLSADGLMAVWSEVRSQAHRRVQGHNLF